MGISDGRSLVDDQPYAAAPEEGQVAADVVGCRMGDIVSWGIGRPVRRLYRSFACILRQRPIRSTPGGAVATICGKGEK